MFQYIYDRWHFLCIICLGNIRYVVWKIREQHLKSVIIKNFKKLKKILWRVLFRHTLTEIDWHKTKSIQKFNSFYLWQRDISLQNYYSTKTACGRYQKFIIIVIIIRLFLIEND